MTEDEITSIQGTEDLLPDQWGHWRRLYATARRLFELYGYGEMRTPIIEEARLFVKGTGATTDIVEKEMYVIPPAEDEETGGVALRPEGTPPVVRGYLEAALHKQQTFQKFYYAGPMFRRERPQKGRLRQFHQLGVEAIGSDSPLLDAETIFLAMKIFGQVGLEESELSLNTLGCRECRPRYRAEVKRMLREWADRLCEDCRRRLERNVFRVLDCKKEGCQEVVQEVPPVTEYLDEECAEHHEALKAALRREGVDFTEDHRLVRGLDYYTRTVYEIKHPGIGARDAICGGGRYDDLVELLGGPSLPCVGFAIGVEPTLLAMEAELGPAEDTSPRPDVYVVRFEEEAREACFGLTQKLRDAGIAAETDFEDRSAKSQMRVADRLNARLCFLIGGRELEQNQVLIRDMAGGEQWNVPREEAPQRVIEWLQENPSTQRG